MGFSPTGNRIEEQTLEALAYMIAAEEVADVTPVAEHTNSSNVFEGAITVPTGASYVLVSVRANSCWLVPADTIPADSAQGYHGLVNSDVKIPCAGKAKIWAKNIVNGSHAKISGLVFHA